ncbi:MAG: rubrerythrin family protein [Ruminococcaceae bacterium]|nr:rubrerythrin family protein [Oscillospiraceae bacterium]
MQWKCSQCGYIWTGDQPPETCPECGAPKEAFEKEG